MAFYQLQLACNRKVLVWWMHNGIQPSCLNLPRIGVSWPGCQCRGAPCIECNRCDTFTVTYAFSRFALYAIQFCKRAGD